MKKCPQCGKELPDGARFCLACGAPQEGAAGAAVARVDGPGAAAQTGGVAAGAGGVAVGRDLIVGGERPLSPADLRTAHLHHLYEQARQLSLSGIDPKAASEAEAKINLGAVYTALLTLTPEESDRLQQGACPPEEMARGGGRRLSVVAQLDRHARLVLLGDPGSGKSTFVNFVALCLAGQALGGEPDLARLTEPLPKEKDDKKDPEPQPWSHGALLPLRVVLRDFAARGLPPVGERATAKHLWDFIAAELEAAALGDYEKPLAQELLRQGGLLLLDGLDEVPEADRRREQIKQAVEGFAGSFPRCRILVTSRTYAYQQQAWRLNSFAETVLAPFGAGQVERFVDRWYAHIAGLRGLHPDDAQGRAELLKRAIANSDRLQGLAARPLLLTLMASLHAWRGGSLPEKREELYADTVDLLLDWWERPKVVRAGDEVRVQQPSLVEWLRVEDRAKVRALLEQLAYRVHAGQAEPVGTADVPEGDLLSGLLRLSRNPEVNPARLVDYLSQRAGLLLPRGVGVYTFPHRTFQEYLAACHLTDHDYPDQVAELARADPGRWREVALLAGAKAARGTASAIWLLVEALCYRDPVEQEEGDAWGALLAGQALVESADLEQVSERNEGKVACVRANLVRLVEAGALPAVERVAAGQMLARLGDPRPGVGVIVGAQRAVSLPDIAWCAVPAGPFLMGSTDEDEMAGSDEKPQRQVELEEYYISRYPVTNAQFAAFVAAGGYGEARYWVEAIEKGYWRDGAIKGDLDGRPYIGPADYGEPFNLPNHPVVGVTWYEAAAFCRWLTEQLQGARYELQVWHKDQLETLSLEPGAIEVRLPGEEEWEKAARGTDGRIYPWGDEADPERANYSETGIGTTSAVGCFPGGVSPYGLEDASGNVWEWVGDGRVVRGGAFYLSERSVRCAYRYRRSPYGRYWDFGFRVVASPI